MDTREAASSTLCAMCQFGTGTSDRYRTNAEAVEEAPTREFLNSGGVERLSTVILKENTRTLDRFAGSTVMYLCGLPGVRTRSQTKALVSLLSCHDKHVVLSTCISIWLLSHEPKNRRLLGDEWAIDGLVKVLQANSDIVLKQSCTAALWLVRGTEGSSHFSLWPFQHQYHNHPLTIRTLAPR